MTVGPLEGYRPRNPGRYDDGPGAQAFYESVLNHPDALEADAINAQERFSLYSLSDFDIDILGGVNWQFEALYTERETTADGIRQFFPLVGGAEVQSVFGVYGYANDPGYSNPFFLSQPILIYQANSQAEVKYLSVSSELNGEFGGTGYFSDWGWTALTTFSRSDGKYGTDTAIFADQSGDVRFDDDAPQFDYQSAEILSGNYPDNFYDTLGGPIVGRTTYEQFVASTYVTGDLFALPAGDVLLALGAEYRGFSIDDQPDEQAQAGNLWGSSSALVTKGEDNVTEIFAEAEFPLLKGAPLVEELTFTASGRAFDYESSGSGDVYKVALDWQVVPAVRFRGTRGTSFRAPALYELFLGQQTGFLDQADIDPCILWEDSTDDDIRANCAAEGIPGDYGGGTSSATIISGGGAGFLEPETSDALTFGTVITPEFFPVSLALDYFEIEVNNQIAQLGAGTILGGCYGGDNFPNDFCDLFTRGTATEPLAVNEVTDTFININSQVTRGLDATLRYERDFDFGTLLVDAQATWTFEDTLDLFDTDSESGFATEDFNRTIGDPDVVGDAQVRFTRGDYTFSWFLDFVGHTSNEVFDPVDTTYFGAPAQRIVETEAVWYHDASVRWTGDLLTITGGITNLFGEEPPIVSDGVTFRRGNVPIFGTQYDLRGRQAFIRVTKEF